MYLEYADYVDMGGTQSESVFTRLEYQARKIVDERTFGRIQAMETVPEAVEMLMFELIGLIGNQDITAEGYGGVAASESNDGYSLTMATGTVLTADQTTAKAGALIETYLANEVDDNEVPLLYCGRLS